MIIGEGSPGSLTVLVSSCSAPRSLQFTLCPLKILSGVCLYLLKFLSRRSQQTDVDNGFAFCRLPECFFPVPPNLGNSLKMRELCKPDGDPCSPSIWRHWKWGRISKLRCSCTSETKPTWSHGQKTQAPDLWPLKRPGPPGLSQPWRQPKCRKNTLFFS